MRAVTAFLALGRLTKSSGARNRPESTFSQLSSDTGKPPYPQGTKTHQGSSAALVAVHKNANLVRNFLIAFPRSLPLAQWSPGAGSGTVG